MRDPALEAVLQLTAAGVDPVHDVVGEPSRLDPELIVADAKRRGVVGSSGRVCKGTGFTSHKISKVQRGFRGPPSFKFSAIVVRFPAPN
jgi:hypothetical protein